MSKRTSRKIRAVPLLAKSGSIILRVDITKQLEDVVQRANSALTIMLTVAYLC